MAKNVLITPLSGLVEFTDGGLVGRLVQSTGKLAIEASGGILGLGDGTTDIVVDSTDIKLSASTAVYAATSSTLTLGAVDSFVAVASPGIDLAGHGSRFGEYDATNFVTSYNTALATLVGGTDFGTLIRGALNGHIVVALHGNGTTDTFSIVSYTTDTSPSHTTAPNALLLQLSRAGTLTLNTYGAGIMQTNGSGVVSVAASVTVAQGGTGRTTGPTASKFIIYDGTKYDASIYDQNSFLKTGDTVAITGTWTFNNTIVGNISGNAATATNATNASAAVTADRWTNNRTFTFTGDVTGSATVDGSENESISMTLATVSSAGTHGTSTQIPVITINAKGLVTSISTTGISTAATTLGGFSASQFLRSDVDTTKSAGKLDFVAGLSSFLRGWESTGKAIVSLTTKDDSTWLGAGAWFDGTNWKQQNSGQTGKSAVLRLVPHEGARWYAGSGVGEGSNITSWTVANGLLLWTAAGLWDATRLTGTIPSGNLTGTYAISISGNAATATSATSAASATTAAAWTTGRTITLTGNVTGVSGTFDGSGNISFATTIAAASVLPSMLNVGDTSNIFPDPEMIDSTIYTGTFVFQAVAADGGTSKQQLVIAPDGAVDRDVLSPAFQVQPSTPYYISVKAEITGSGTNVGQAFFVTYSDLAATTEITATQIGADVSSNVPAYRTGIVTTDATARRAKIRFRNKHNDGLKSAVFSEPIIRPAAGTYLIPDDAITSAKIADATIINANLSSGSFPNITGVGTLGSLSVTGTVTAATFSGALSGNATTASAWATGRTITLTGNVTGVSAAWTGSGNISFATTIASLPAISGAALTNLTAANLTGTVPSASLNASAYTALQNLTYSGQITSTIATGSAPFIVASTTMVTNLNAQFLNGIASSGFAAASHTHTLADVTGLVAATGNAGKYLRVNAGATAYEAVTTATLAADIGAPSSADPTYTGSFTLTGTAPAIYITETDQTMPAGRWRFLLSADAFSLQRNTHASIPFSTSTTPISVAATDVVTFSQTPLVGANAVWHEGNDGAASSLDAGLLGGQAPSYYLDPANITGTIPSGKLSGSYTINVTGTLTGNASSATSAATWTNSRTISLTGDATGSQSFNGSANFSVAVTLASAGSPGTYRSVTTDAKGRVISGTNPTTIAGYGLTDAQSNIVFTRTLPIVVNDYVELGAWTIAGGGHSFLMSVTTSDTGVSVTKTYSVSVKLNDTNNVWFTLAPITSSGPHSTTGDFEVDINVNATVASFRLRRTLGTGAATATITIIPTGLASDSWVGASGTGTMSAPASILQTLFDGVGSGLDAETLAGQAASYYLAWANITGKPTTVAGYGITNAITTTGGGTINGGNLQIGGANNDTEILLLPFGSTTAPSITVIGNTDTGFYWGGSGANVGITVDAVSQVEFLGNFVTRFGYASTGAGAVSRSLFIGTNHGGAAPIGAYISMGGAYDPAAATFDTYSTTANENGATIISLQASLTSPQFSILHVQSTASAAAQSNQTPRALLEIFTPTSAGTNVANYFKLTATATGTGPLIEFTGSDTNVSGRLQAKGTGTINILSKLDIDHNLELDSAYTAGFGGAQNSTDRIAVVNLNPAVSSNTSNTRNGVYVDARALNIASTFTDSGWRRGLFIDAAVNDSQLVGTLATQVGGTFQHGHVSGAGTGTITTSIGVAIYGFAGGSSTVGTAYGIYQTSAIAGTTNFFGSPIVIGSASGISGEELYVTGNAKITTSLVVGTDLTVGTTAAHKIVFPGYYEEVAGADTTTYRNVVAYDSTSSSVTGTMKITLPVSWTSTLITVKLLIGNLSAQSWTEVTVSGYNAPSAWTQTRVFANANFPGTTIRLGHDGTKCVILIGAVGTAWSYPKVIVKEVSAARASQSSFGAGWTIAPVVSEAGITVSATPDINADFQTGAYSTSVAAIADTIAVRDGSGDLFANMFRSEQNSDAGAFAHVVVQNARGPSVDNALRTASLATFKSVMNLVIGTDIQAYSAGLTSIAGLASNGVVTRTGTNTFAIRAIGAASSIDILDRAAGDARYIQTSGASTFTTVTLSDAAPAIVFEETDQTMPAGRWRVAMLAGIFAVQRNTHASTPFSTSTTPFQISAGDVVAFSQTPKVGLNDVYHAGNFVAGTHYIAATAIGVDVQGYTANLQSLGALDSTAGMLAQTGAATFARRTLTAGSSKISITNGAGTAGNPTVDVAEANLTLQNLGGLLTVAKGGTGAGTLTGYVKGNGTSAFTASATIPEADIASGTVFPRLADVETITGLWTYSRSIAAAVSATDYIVFQPTDYTTGKPALSIGKAAGSAATAFQIRLFDGTNNNGTLDLVVQNLTHNGSEILTAANFVAGTDYQAYDADLQAIAGLSTNGVITRTGAGTAAIRTIGVAGAPDIPDRAAADTRYAQLGVANTFAGTLNIANTAPILVFDETDQVMPAGLWRLVVSGGVFSVRRNTHATTDFTTENTAISISTGDVVSFIQTPLVSGGAVYHAGNFVAGTDYLAPTGDGSGLTGIVASAVTGTLAVANGGTGQTTYTNGQLLIGNTTGGTLVKATLTPTANRILITNGAGSITIDADATSANTANKIVARDGSGNFSAGTITAALTGNASTATTLQTSRNINGVGFNGSANINVPNLLATNGTTVVASIGVTSGVNYLQITNSIATAPVLITTAGSDTNIGLTISTKGTGPIIIDTGTGAGQIDLKSGTSPVRIWDDNSSHYYAIITGDRAANYNINLPAGDVTLVAGTMVPTTGTGATGTWGISVSGNAATATTAAAWTTGRTITLTGDVTGVSAAWTGSGNISFATAIANDVVDNAALANMAQSTIKGRTAGAGTGDPVDLTAAQTWTILGTIPDANISGAYTGLTNITASGNVSVGALAVGTTTFLNKAYFASTGTIAYDSAHATAQDSDNMSMIIHNVSNTSAAFAQIVLRQRNTAVTDTRLVAGGGTTPFFDIVLGTVKAFSLTQTGDLTLLGNLYSVGMRTFQDGNFSVASDGVAREYLLRGTTTNAVQTEIFRAGSVRLTLPNDTTWAFEILVAARRTDVDGDSASWKIKGVIHRHTTAASTAIVGAVAREILSRVDTAWDVSVNADTTNGSLRVQVTGTALKTVNWVAHVKTVEITG